MIWVTFPPRPAMAAACADSDDQKHFESLLEPSHISRPMSEKVPEDVPIDYAEWSQI